MTACIQCGSIRVRVVGGGPIQRVLALLFRQQVIVCGRCGWKGRQPRQRGTRAGGRGSTPATPADGPAAGAAVDLQALDRDLDPRSGETPERRGGR